MEKQNPRLTRFYEPHRINFSRALAEIRNGRKQEHWIWYVFPVIDGIWESQVSRYFSLSDVSEAEAFLNDPQLGAGLLEITQALIMQETNDPVQVLASEIDAEKVHSCMTLFSRLSEPDSVFHRVLEQYYDSREHAATLALM